MSLIHAQNTRPTALKMEMMPTPRPAAVTGFMPTICCAIGDAWLMIMIPADTFRNSMNHSSQNCQVPIAWVTEKSTVVAVFCTAEVGCQPAGRQPAGGLPYACAAATTRIRYATPNTQNVVGTPLVWISRAAIGLK